MDNGRATLDEIASPPHPPVLYSYGKLKAYPCLFALRISSKLHDKAHHEPQTHDATMREESLSDQVRRDVRTTFCYHVLPGLRLQRPYQDPNVKYDLESNRAKPNLMWRHHYILFRLDFVYLAVLMGVLTRAIPGWRLERDLTEEAVPTTVETALAVYRAARTHHFD